MSVELNSWVIDESVEVSATQIKNNAFYMNARPKEEGRRDEKTNRCYLIIGNRCFIPAKDRKFSVMMIAFAMRKWQESRGKGKLDAKAARRAMGREGSECRLSRGGMWGKWRKIGVDAKNFGSGKMAV